MLYQLQRRHAWGVLILLMLLSACGGMSEDEKEIAVAVALTQTAAAVEPVAQESELSTPEPDASVEEATVTPEAAVPTATVGEQEPVADIVPTPTLQEEVVAASDAEPDSGASALVIDQLPVTQNSAKVRSLLVAPGEPGALYALLTDEVLASDPATGARLLVSRNFGAFWEPAASALPVADSCLLNVNMDYYGATALYASTCQGIYRWAPGDGEWTLVSPEQTGMVAVVYGNARTLWATRPFLPEGAPVILSQNGGESWNEIEMMHFNGVANIGISPRDSQSGYAIIWPKSAGSYLRRGSMFNEWQTMPTPADNSVINTGMTIDGGTGWLYVTTPEAEGDRLWRSSDPDTPLIEDVSWEEVHRFAPGMTVELLASGWSSEEKELAIYANLQTIVDGQSHYTLIRSLDSGQTWAPLVVDAG